VDYTLFIHVLDGDGQMIGQHDGQPSGGEYPTSLWDAGEQGRDARTLKLLSAAQRLRVG
jgi:hypothetical protein